VVQQPVFPAHVRPTVWLQFSPHLTNQLWIGERAVAGGPVRLLSLGLAVGLALWFLRGPRTPSMLLWCVIAVLSFRYLLEPGVEPYYLWPTVAVALVAAAVSGSSRRLGAVGGLGLALTWLANVHVHSEALWWPIGAGLLVLVALTFPVRPDREPAEDDHQDDHQREADPVPEPLPEGPKG
jgi:hypothetical protein